MMQMEILFLMILQSEAVSIQADISIDTTDGTATGTMDQLQSTGSAQRIARYGDKATHADISGAIIIPQILGTSGDTSPVSVNLEGPIMVYVGNEDTSTFEGVIQGSLTIDREQAEKLDSLAGDGSTVAVHGTLSNIELKCVVE